MILSPCHTLLDASGFRGPTREAVALGFQSFDLFLDLREQNQEKKKKKQQQKNPLQQQNLAHSGYWYSNEHQSAPLCF